LGILAETIQTSLGKERTRQKLSRNKLDFSKCARGAVLVHRFKFDQLSFIFGKTFREAKYAKYIRGERGEL